MQKGNVTIKLWDIGGQPRFRSMWERYCRGVNAIVYDNSNDCTLREVSDLWCYSLLRYVVDAADHDKFETAKKELHDLLSKPPLANIPLLVLGNKNDLPEAIGVNEIIEQLWVFLVQTKTTLECICSDDWHVCRDLKSIQGREVCCYSISAKNSVNIDITLDWLIKHSS